MITAFFESIRYVGYLWPMAFLRIYVSYYYLDMAYARVNGDFLEAPRLAVSITRWIPMSHAPEWYLEFLENVVVPNWKIFAYTITYFEFVIGISFLIGFLVRPVALLGIFLCINSIYAIGFPTVEQHQLLLSVFLVLLLMGAGRCLGLDYFFYKRQRGLWW